MAVTKAFEEHVVRLMKKIETIPEASMEVFLWDLIHMSIGDLREYSYHTLSLKNRSESRSILGIKIVADRRNNTLVIIDVGFGRNVLGLISDFVHLRDDDVKLYEKKIDECLMSGDPSSYYEIKGICLGVYAAFMVATKVVITSKPVNDDHVYVWESQGLIDDDGSGSRSGSYTITPRPASTSKDALHRGTMVTLHLKPQHVDKYLDSDKLVTLVSNLNSDRCAYPIDVYELLPEGDPMNKSGPLRFLDTSQDIASLKVKFEPLRKVCSEMLGGWVKEVVIDDSVYDLPVALSLYTNKFEINPRHHSIKLLLKEYSDDPDKEKDRVAHTFQLHYHKLLCCITKREPLEADSAYHARFGDGCGNISGRYS